MLAMGLRQSGLGVTRYTKAMASALERSKSYVMKYLRIASHPVEKRAQVKARTFRGLWNELFPVEKSTIETEGEEVPDHDGADGDDGESRDGVVAPKDRFRCDEFVRAVSELTRHAKELDRGDAGSCVALAGGVMLCLGQLDGELAEQVRKTLPQIHRACRPRKKRRSVGMRATVQVRS